MDGKMFSQGFEKKPSWRGKLDEQQQEMLQTPLEWSDSFSLALHNYFRGGEISDDEATDFIVNYANWLNGSSFKQSAESALDYELQSNGHNANIITNHLINSDFVPIWLRFLKNQQRIPADAVKATQNRLAARAVELMPIRADAVKNGTYLGNEGARERDMFVGYLNEIDTAIVALDISLKHPHIAVLPSPSQFSMSTDSDRNSDFVVIDLQTRSAHGIQTKMSVSDEKADDADLDYVSLVDGRIDFDSVKYIRKYSNSSYEVRESWPGYIAAHHLNSEKKPIALDNYTKNTLISQVDRRVAMQIMIEATNQVRSAKSIAKEHIGSSHSTNKKAAKIVLDRVMSELTRE